MKTSNLKHLFLTCLAAAGTFSLHAADLTWDATTGTTGAQDGAGIWTNALPNTNWWNGAANVTWNNATPDNAIFGAGSGAAGMVTVSSNTTNTVGNITFNAPGSGFYTIAGSSSTTSKLNLNGTPTITVASGVFATNSVVLTGTGFVKDGSGTLVFSGSASNIFTGSTTVTNGTLILAKSDNIVAVSGDLIVASGASVVAQKKAQLAATANLTVNGTFDTGANILSLNSLVVDNNAQVIGSSSSVAITNTTLYDFRSGTVAPNLAGTAGLTKTTAGTVTLANGGGADTFTGPVLVSAGILQLNHSGTGAGLPGVTTTITNTGTVQLLHDTEFNTNATVIVAGGTFDLAAHNDTVSTLVLDNSGQILNAGNTSKTLTVLTNLDFRSGFCASKLGGAGLMVKSTAGTVTLTMDNANTGGTFISAGILVLGDGSSTNRGQFGTGPVTNNAVIVFNHSTNFTLANVISGTGSLTNLGGGPSLTLASTYTGNTTVSGGKLFANCTNGSATGTGTVTVQSTAALGGTGIIGGIVNIQAGGNLAPGNTGQGTLTISNTLNLAGNTTIKITSATNGFSVDQVIANVANYGGTLTVVTNMAQTNAPGFSAGNTFQIFVAGSSSANFSGLVGSPGPNLNWSFNPTNGVLSIVSATTTPPVLSVSPPSGGNMTFTWTDPTFKLQSQTNTLIAGLSTNWSDYPGGSASPVTVSNDLSKPTVFFRLSQ